MVDDSKDRPVFERDRDGRVVAFHGEALPKGMLNIGLDLEDAAHPQPSTARSDAVIAGVYAHADRLRAKPSER
jgi:hypothetical protein